AARVPVDVRCLEADEDGSAIRYSHEDAGVARAGEARPETGIHSGTPNALTREIPNPGLRISILSNARIRVGSVATAPHAYALHRHCPLPERYEKPRRHRLATPDVLFSRRLRHRAPLTHPTA